jgi:hypothetical protein
MSRGLYDLQKIRINTGNRLVSAFKVKLGVAPGEKEELSEKEVRKILEQLKESYTRITDGIAEVTADVEFPVDEIISTNAELLMVDQYFSLLRGEVRQTKQMEKLLKSYPIYTEYLCKVTGVGPLMATVIISEFDITKARYASSLWKYAGLDVAGDGKGRSRKAEHLVDREYKNRDGGVETKKSVTFNPRIKTKLVGVLADVIIKLADWTEVDDDAWAAAPQHRRRIKPATKKKPERKLVLYGSGSEFDFAPIYYDYKNRLQHRPDLAEASKKHINDMAKRYMIKMFLIPVYKYWRTLEGLEVYPPYHEAKLGLKHVEKLA